MKMAKGVFIVLCAIGFSKAALANPVNQTVQVAGAFSHEGKVFEVTSNNFSFLERGRPGREYHSASRFEKEYVTFKQTGNTKTYSGTPFESITKLRSMPVYKNGSLDHVVVSGIVRKLHELKDHTNGTDRWQEPIWSETRFKGQLKDMNKVSKLPVISQIGMESYDVEVVLRYIPTIELMH